MTFGHKLKGFDLNNQSIHYAFNDDRIFVSNVATNSQPLNIFTNFGSSNKFNSLG